MDVDDMPPVAGPSRHQFMDVEGDENNDTTQLPHIPVIRATASQHDSRSGSVARSTTSSTPSQVNHFLSYPGQEPPKTIKLLYIPDPTRGKERQDVSNSLSWVKRYLREDQLRSIQHLKGFYVKARASMDDLDFGGLPCRMFEWVSSRP